MVNFAEEHTLDLIVARKLRLRLFGLLTLLTESAWDSRLGEYACSYLPLFGYLVLFDFIYYYYNYFCKNIII